MFFLSAVANARLKTAAADPGGGDNTMATPFYATMARSGGTYTLNNQPNAARYLNLLQQFLTYNSGYVEASTEDAREQTRMAASGVLADFGVYISANNRGDPTVFTVVVNGVDSALTVSVPAASTGWFDTGATTLAVAQDDLVTVRMNTGAGLGAISLQSMQASFLADVGTVNHLKLVGDYTSLTTSAASTSVMSAPVHGCGEWNSFGSGWTSGGGIAEANIVCTDGTLARAYVHIPTNTATVAHRYELFKNNVATGLYIEVAAGATGWFSNTADSVAVVAGDLLEWRRWCPVAGTGSYKTGHITIAMTTASGYDIMTSVIPAESPQGYNDAFYYFGFCRIHPVNANTSGYLKHRAVSDLRMTELRAFVNNSGAGASGWEMRVVKNGVDTALSASVPLASGGHYVSGSGAFSAAADDQLYIKFQTAAFSQSPFSATLKVEPPSP